MSGNYRIQVDGFEFVVTEHSMFEPSGISVFMPEDDLERDYSHAFKIAPQVYKGFCLYLTVSFIAESFGGAQYIETHGEYSDRLQFTSTVKAFFDSGYDRVLLEIGENLKELQSRFENPEYYPVRAKTETTRKTPKAGYVYLISDGSGLYKIGRTKMPDERLKTLRIGAHSLEYVALIQTSDMVKLEISLHETYGFARAKGEWFNLAPDDVEYIKSLAVQA